MARADYRVFNIGKLKGLKDAERHKMSLEKRFDIVKVNMVGINKVAIYGEAD